MSPRGGYQRPANPAPVSNPGAGSRRTDSGQKAKVNSPVTRTPLEGLKMGGNVGYGDVGRIQQLGKGLPTPAAPAGGPPPRVAGGGGGRARGKQESMLSRPTDFPNQPITAGIGQVQNTYQAPLQLDGAIQVVESLIARTKNPSNELKRFYLDLRAEQQRGPRA